MMTNRFLLAKIDIQYEGKHVETEGNLSEIGVTRVFYGKQLPMELLLAIGRKLTVIYGGHRFSGVLVQQFIEHGQYYDIRFLELTEGEKKFLHNEIEQHGNEPQWVRKYPRIPVMGTETNVTIPNLCVLNFMGQEHYLKVLNFTLGGIRVETMENSLTELRVAAVLSFELLTTKGDILRDMRGEVRNIATHSGLKSIGIRILGCHPVTEKEYKNLIRDYCLVLQKKMNGP